MNIIEYFMKEFDMTKRGAKGYRTRIMKQLQKDTKVEIVTDLELQEILSVMSSKGKYSAKAKALINGDSPTGTTAPIEVVEMDIRVTDTVYHKATNRVGYVNDKIGMMAEIFWKYVGYEQKELVPGHELVSVTREEGRKLAGLDVPPSADEVRKMPKEDKTWIKWKHKKDTGRVLESKLKDFCEERSLKLASVMKCLAKDMKSHKQYTFSK